MNTFAIVIPNYNSSRYLWTALESLKHQDYPFKLAVMDGGSTDGFEDAVSPYLDMIDHMETGPDKGQADAIGKGFDILPGDILGWINSDDYYFPGVFPTIASIFENHPEIDVVYGNAIHVSPDCCFNSYFPYTREFDAKHLTQNCYICQPACFFRRTAYDAIGKINPKLTYTMDWDLWCRFAVSGARFLNISNILAAVRYYPETKTLSGGGKRYREIMRIERRYRRRPVPVSLIGFYYYDLSWKAKKSVFETALFLFLKSIRSIKGGVETFQNTHRNKISSLFGFDKRDGFAKGACEIHMPWYGNAVPKQFFIRVAPKQMSFDIEINSMRGFVKTDNGTITVDHIHPVSNCISVRLAPREERRWKLLEFTGKQR